MKSLMFRTAALLVIASASTTPLLAAEQTTATRPNIVVLLADDLGYTDLACYGSSFYETPNLDAMAKDGIMFTQAYAACPVCSPSRAALLTGKYPARLDTTDFFHDQDSKKAQRKLAAWPMEIQRFKNELPLSEETLAEALKGAGYKTFMAGKWHLGNYDKYGPQLQGFDKTVGAFGAGHPKHYLSPYENPYLPDGPKGEYLTDRLTSEAISFIRDNKSEPFFVYLPFYAVHTPLEGRPDLVKKYEAKRKALGLGDEFTSDGLNTVRTNQSHAVYAAMVEGVDENVGRLNAELKKLGLDENTIVMFTSDNGGLSTYQGFPTSNLPFRGGKGFMYEGGIREPLIVKWPSVIKPGQKSEAVVTGTDFYPTLLEAAGLPLMPEQHKDGKSFIEVLKGNAAADRGPIFWHYPHFGDQGGSPASAVRDGDWKLIKWYLYDKYELFNLKDDPAEKHDLFAEKPEVAQKLKTELDAWLKDMNAKIPKMKPGRKPEWAANFMQGKADD